MPRNKKRLSAIGPRQLTPSLCQRRRQLPRPTASCAIMRMPAWHNRQWLNAAFLILKI